MNPETEVEVEEVKKEEHVIEQLPYKDLFETIYNLMKTTGQLVYVEGGETSKIINVVRILSNGDKQFFKVSIEDTDQLVLKK